MNAAVLSDTTGDSQQSANSAVLWLFVAVLITFVVTRLVTRRIRTASREKEPGGIVGDISVGGVHIHHQVFGIVIMTIAGLTLIAATPQGVALDVCAAAFGVGVGLAFDEFALWVHLRDVYWTNEGRQSVDAIFCVLMITGLLIGGTGLVVGEVGTAAWWSSIAGLLVTLGLSVLCTLKGKLITGVIGIVFFPAALIGAIRLAKPASWWARRRYPQRPPRAARAQRRFGSAYERRWNRVRDIIGGAPNR